MSSLGLIDVVCAVSFRNALVSELDNMQRLADNCNIQVPMEVIRFFFFCKKKILLLLIVLLFMLYGVVDEKSMVALIGGVV